MPGMLLKQFSSLSAEDRGHILAHTQGLREELRGRRLFVTGGTGFFGTWLIESFLWANDELDLGAEAVVLSRDPGSFLARRPGLAARGDLSFHTGDVRDFESPRGGFSHVVHAATEASVRLNVEEPRRMFDTIVDGARRTLEFARRCGAEKFLFTSSGAVYGKQPAELSHVPESYEGAPDPLDPRSAYGEGKRAAEHLCALYARERAIEVKIARCFAFVGPHLPLDGAFAVGNFVRDALGGGPIRIAGDGAPYRSYLYAADLAIWLWTILFRGQAGRAYNVGSDRAISIGELAHEVAARFAPCPAVDIARAPIPGQLPPRYVPSIERASAELGLHPWIDLAEAIGRTVRWHQDGQER